MKFYKRDPDRAIAGMAELTLKQRGAYNSILDLLYSRDGDVPDDDLRISKMISCHIREWKAVKKELFDLGKVWVTDGKLMAKRVQETIKDAAKFSQEQSKRASSGVVNSENVNENKGGDKPDSFESASPEKKPSTATATATATPNIRIEEPLLSPSETAAAISGWNLLAREVKIPEVQRLTEVRKTKLLKRLSEVGGISGWESMLEIIRQSPALTGGTNMDWRVNFDWVLEPKNLTKIMEKNYVRKSSGDQRNAASFFDNLDAAIDEHENSGAASGIRDEV